ncbi:MAG: hypothetical protein L6Q71_04005 [Planctomycetes bacterium]|nr:hypothetical protein [Planctomycetota bacterium]NUQ33720.1 hypothetical protein [Planctomycetaceae bacterium]
MRGLIFVLVSAALAEVSGAVGAQAAPPPSLYPQGVAKAADAFKRTFIKSAITEKLKQWNTNLAADPGQSSSLMANFPPIVYSTKGAERTYYLIDSADESSGVIQGKQAVFVSQGGLVTKNEKVPLDLVNLDPVSLVNLFDYRYIDARNADGQVALAGYAACISRTSAKGSGMELPILLANAALTTLAKQTPSLKPSVDKALDEISGFKGAELDVVTLTAPKDDYSSRWALTLPKGDAECEKLYRQYWETWCKREMETVATRIRNTIETGKLGLTLNMLKAEVDELVDAKTDKGGKKCMGWVAGSEALKNDMEASQKGGDKSRMNTLWYWKTRVDTLLTEAESARKMAGEAYTQAYDSKTKDGGFGDRKLWEKALESYRKLIHNEKSRQRGIDPNVGFDYVRLARTLYYLAEPVSESAGCGHPGYAKESLSVYDIAKKYYPYYGALYIERTRLFMALKDYKSAYAELKLFRDNPAFPDKEDQDTADKLFERVKLLEVKEVKGQEKPPEKEKDQ